MNEPGPAPADARAPRAIRAAAIGALALSAIVGFFAFVEAVGLTNLDQLRDATPSPIVPVDPELLERAHAAQIAALESMKTARAFCLGALSVACSVTFVAAGRLLRPRGLPREGVRRLLAGSALAAALLRTIDGSQWAVVAKQMGRALARTAEKMPPEKAAAADAQRWADALFPGVAMVQTVLVAGAFAGLAVYFLSEPVRDWTRSVDPPTG